ncbi:hypothetical protein B0T14DRAFT_489976 [Immersiella caudata]|uniref:Uncharacterized protein n=1 Tax=Immersiella caudata TaxID=314043 RepID=A0AA40CAR0_9PEZI|nr:hypothetical protein B0T14DRAFT_489976 [Immersiella caudata]
MFKSIFSYPLEKPYPFRWFTTAVFTGGIIALTLASFLSVATQGYETVSAYTPNPNVTDGGSIFTDWPSFLTTNTKPVCSPTSIPSGTQFLTNNTAFRYSILGISHSTDGVQPAALVGSFPYQNNPFQNCSIRSVDIELESVQRDAIQIARGLWGAALKAYMDCIVETPTGLATLSLSTMYDLNPASRTRQFATQPNKTTQASLFMAQTLLASYARNLTDEMTLANAKYRPEEQVFKGVISFSRRPAVRNVTSLDYFIVDGCFFLSFDTQSGGRDQVYYCQNDNRIPNRDTVEILAKSNIDRRLLPGIWIAADSAAKMFYWTVMTDLGQTNAGPNPLVEKELMAHFSKIATAPTMADKLFEKSEFLGVSPAVMATSYLCQVPRLKSTGTLLVAVLINDIVILSALWRLFVLLVGYFLLKPDMMVCEGCVEREPLILTPERKALRVSTV